jgi:putative tryptophan/tyrosine transport system substrate-binding protein
MKRREFITLLGSAAGAWPLASRAQQPAMPVIGLLSVRSPEESAHLLRAFLSGLSESGIVEGQNTVIQYRWAHGEYDRLPTLAAELVHAPVAVLVAVGGEPAARAAKTATTSIPVVTIFSTDPVKSGLISSLSHPGGNVTGVSNLATAMEPKRVGLLHELVPQAKAFGALINPDFPTFADQLADIQAAAQTTGLELHVFRAATNRDIEAAFEAITQQQIAALLVAADPFFNSRRDQIVGLAARRGVPAMYSFRDYAVAGGLMSYGIDLPDTYRQAGAYAGRVLKGAKPAELPVLQPTKFEFVINLKAAKALGVKFSDNLMSLADEVIE